GGGHAAAQFLAGAQFLGLGAQPGAFLFAGGGVGGGGGEVGAGGGQQLLGPFDRVLDGGGVGDGKPGRAADLGDQSFDALLGLRQIGAGGSPAVGEPLFGDTETAGVEQPFQQLLALVVLGAQEAREIALRQQDHLEELVGAHPEQPHDLLTD